MFSDKIQRNPNVNPTKTTKQNSPNINSRNILSIKASKVQEDSDWRVQATLVLELMTDRSPAFAVAEQHLQISFRTPTAALQAKQQKNQK